MPRALLLSYHFPPDNVPATLHPRFFAKYLPRFGFEVQVVTSSFSPLGYTNPQADPDPAIHRTPLEPNALRTMQALHRWESIFGHFLKIPDWGRSWIRHGAAAAINLARESPFDLMVSFSPCFATHRAALRVKQRFPNMPWFAYLADPFVGNPMNPVNPLQLRLNHRLEAQVFEAATAVIGNTEAIAAVWRDRYPRLAERFSAIPNGFDLEEPVGPLPIPVGRPAPVLLHAGAIYGARFPGMLFESIARLHARNILAPANLNVRLLGDGGGMTGDRASLFADMQSLGYAAADGPVSRPEAIRRTGQADYLLLLDLNDSNAKLQVPSKLFDYLRIGRPILCYTARGSETEKILHRAKAPAVCIAAESGPGEADRLLLEFLKLPTDPQPLSDWARTTFDAQEMTKQLIALYRNTSNHAKPLPSI